MKTKTFSLTKIAVATLCLAGATAAVQAEETAAKATLDMNLRYETVDQDNALKDADALTLRSRLTYQTASKNGFSAVVEFEDSRDLGVDDYYSKEVGVPGNGYSVIADPNHTELDQAFVQYKKGNFTAKVGRQVITLDGHRFVGHVGWRQDRQTFDAAKFVYAKDNLTATYAHIQQVNGIFGENHKAKTKDHLLNVSYKTGLGKLVGYSYILEADTSGAESLDTYGVSFSGKKDKLSYALEFATQEKGDVEADYMFAEAGYAFDMLTVKAGYELLGSDDGMYGFSTPYATKHKFNGWADTFLGTPPDGLEDVYVTLAGKVAGGKWAVTYHDYSADEGSTDYGDEINAVYARPINKTFSAGVKLASYSAGDADSGKVDTDKLWVWVGAKF